MLRPYVLFLFLVSTEIHSECTEPGKARWAIKSSVTSITALQHPQRIDLQDLRDLPEPPDVTNNDARYREHRIPAFDNPANLQEGDIVSVEGYLYLVVPEGNDCENHIQISDSPTSGNHCVIVEVPRAHQVSVPMAGLRSRVKTVRDFVKARLLAGQELRRGWESYGRCTLETRLRPASRSSKGMAYEHHSIYLHLFSRPMLTHERKTLSVEKRAERA